MEYVSGCTLSSILEGEGKPGKAHLEKRLRLFWQLLQSIQYAHSQNVVHRDLKPDNVMLVPDPFAPGGERAKLLDFGIAKMGEPSSDSLQTDPDAALTLSLILLAVAVVILIAMRDRWTRGAFG